MLSWPVKSARVARLPLLPPADQLARVAAEGLEPCVARAGARLRVLDARAVARDRCDAVQLRRDTAVAKRLLALPDDRWCEFFLSFGYPEKPEALTWAKLNALVMSPVAFRRHVVRLGTSAPKRVSRKRSIEV